jgi:hypothetical protein
MKLIEPTISPRIVTEKTFRLWQPEPQLLCIPKELQTLIISFLGFKELAGSLQFVNRYFRESI